MAIAIITFSLDANQQRQERPKDRPRSTDKSIRPSLRIEGIYIRKAYILMSLTLPICTLGGLYQFPRAALFTPCHSSNGLAMASKEKMN